MIARLARRRSKEDKGGWIRFRVSGISERTDAVDRAGILATRGSPSPQPARQLVRASLLDLRMCIVSKRLRRQQRPVPLRQGRAIDHRHEFADGEAHIDGIGDPGASPGGCTGSATGWTGRTSRSTWRNMSSGTIAGTITCPPSYSTASTGLKSRRGGCARRSLITETGRIRGVPDLGGGQAGSRWR